MTRNQYDRLLPLANGNAGMSRKQRDTEPLIREGWVTGDWDGKYWQMVRITPAGLRALANAVIRHGLPGLGPTETTRRRVCADCGSALHRFTTEAAA